MNIPFDFGPNDGTNAGAIGRCVECVPGRRREVTRLDATGAVGQRYRVTAGGAGNSATYSIRIQLGSIDTESTYITDSSSSATELGAGLTAALQANGTFGVIASAVYVSAGVFDILFRPGLDVATVTFPLNPSTHLSGSNTAATAAAQYIFGRAAEVVAQTGTPVNPRHLGTEYVQLPVAISGLTGAVATFVNTHAASADYFGSLIVDGVGVSFTFASGADQAATDVLAVAALTAAFTSAYGGVVAQGSAGTQTVTFPAGKVVSRGTPGFTPATAAFAVTVAASATTYPYTLVVDGGSTPSTDLGPGNIASPTGPLVGAAVLCADYAGGSAYVVESPGAVVAGTPVYVETAAGDNRGRLYNTTSATRRLWSASYLGPAPVWLRNDPLNSNAALIAF